MRKVAITSIIIVLVASALPGDGITSFQAHADEFNLWGMVSDKQTREPIGNAIVYAGGTGALRVRTNQAGVYHLEIDWGEVYLNAFMKGYSRADQRIVLAQNEIREVNFELDPKNTSIEQVTITGTVEVRIVKAGTRSENRYVELHPSNMEVILMFDEIGMNTIRKETLGMAVEDVIGKLVTITGFYEIGYIGWEHEKARGIYVEDIKLVQ
jgi:hypothetical protein